MGIEDTLYIQELRQRAGCEEDDTSMDSKNEAMSPIQRVEMIAGWELGDPGWVGRFKDWFESQGLLVVDKKKLENLLTTLHIEIVLDDLTDL